MPVMFQTLGTGALAMWRLRLTIWRRSKAQKPLYGDLLKRASLRGGVSVANLDKLCGYLGWKPRYEGIDLRHQTWSVRHNSSLMSPSCLSGFVTSCLAIFGRWLVQDIMLDFVSMLPKALSGINETCHYKRPSL
jgi:hypothetical protein